MTVKLWSIAEKPGYEVEFVNGTWLVWGPCCHQEGCVWCDGENTRILDTCGQDKDGNPANPDMVADIIKLDHWTPERII